MGSAETWLADGARFSGEQQLNDQRSHIHSRCAMVGVLWLVAVTVGTFGLSDRVVKSEVESAASAAAHQASTTVRIVNRMFVEMSSFAQVIARQAAVHELLNRYTSTSPALLGSSHAQRRELFSRDAKLRETADFFNAICKDLSYGRVFLLNTAGLTMASNDYANPASILGNMYGDRPYFIEAMREGSGRLFAAGRTTSVPGYFFASRVDDGGRAIGVVVVKQDATAMAPLLAGSDLTMIIDDKGIVVGSSDNTLLMRHAGALSPLAPTPEDLRERLKLDHAEPLRVERPKLALHPTHWLIEGRPMLVTSSALSDPRFQLLTLSTIGWVPAMVRTHYAIAVLVALLGLLALAFVDRLLTQWARQRHTELKLSAQLSLFMQSMIDRLPSPIFYKGPDTRFLGCNQAYEKTFGITREQLIGKRVTDLEFLDKAQREAFEREQQAILQDGSSINREVELPHADGTLHTALYSVSPFGLPDGTPAGVVGVLVDISPLKESQAALQVAKEAAEAANRAKSEFLANMSHEIRTPMNAVLGMTHLALKSGLNARQHNYVLKVERSARSLLGVINDILDFSKIEAGKLDMEQVPFDLGDVMENLADLIGLQAEEKAIELLFSEPPDLPARLIGDPLRLGQVLVNLCSNAVKFTSAGEVIVSIEQVSHVETAAENAAVGETVALRFAVRDTGVGMSAQECARLFQPFSQADSSISRRFGGTGLGLAISRYLVGRMGGEVSVASEPGVGSLFSFTAHFGLQAALVAEAGLPVPVKLAGARMLVVDDNASSRQILGEMSAALGLETQTAFDGWEALRAVALAAQQGLPFDLVLIDWKMPGMDGIECARQLAQGEHDHRPTVLMTTAYGREEVLQRLAGTDIAVRDVLVKPVTPSNLLEACGLALGRRELPERRGQQQQEWMAVQRTRLAGTRVLLVEDNLINQELAIELLSDAGMVVTLAGDGRDAIALLHALPQGFDGVLMDCQMPVLDGYAATREIRSDPRWQRLPIIAMTANAMSGDRELALAAGMDDHIAKPLDVKAMFETIARWLRP